MLQGGAPSIQDSCVTAAVVGFRVWEDGVMSSSTPTLLRADDRAIAVIGMSGRFPGAPTVAALWDLLASGGDAVTGAPSDRPWLREPHDPRPGTQGRVLPDRGGFLPGLDLFDAAFFDMSPREACRTDPQTRLLLE